MSCPRQVLQGGEHPLNLAGFRHEYFGVKLLRLFELEFFALAEVRHLRKIKKITKRVNSF